MPVIPCPHCGQPIYVKQLSYIMLDKARAREAPLVDTNPASNTKKR